MRENREIGGSSPYGLFLGVKCLFNGRDSVRDLVVFSLKRLGLQGGVFIIERLIPYDFFFIIILTNFNGIRIFL